MHKQSGWGRVWRHLWCDERHIRRALSPQALERLTQHVSASEALHTGEIRYCVEASLPVSYLRRGAPARERAEMLFGKLRVWDTANRNGVLIYLLLADHAIEIVADRGLNACVDPATWSQIAEHMADDFRQHRFEQGLTRALDEVSALLIKHCPAPANATRLNELPNRPVLL